MTDHIIQMLRGFQAPNVFNPWSDRDRLDIDPYRAPDQRIERLMQHFDVRPKFLLIGEAPGYQGCRFSGVPFTNESIICKGLAPRLENWSRFTSRPLPWCEPSATIVWGALHQNDIADQVVMWNAFAFHPHRPDQPYSNRRPSKPEQRSGADITRAVLKHFAGAKVVAVGQVAGEMLRMIGFYNFDSVRHPSMGGATEFRTGLANIVTGVAA